MRLIKAYNMGSRSFQKFSHAISEENRIWNLVTHKTAPPYAAFLLLVECGMLLMIPAGGLMFLRGSVSASVFLLFAYVGGMYLTEILPLQKMSTTFAQALSGVGKVREILELPVFEGGGPFPEDHGIELDHVTFSYDGKTDVLRDCSLSVKQGEKVALVGVSGAGKSTIIQLISRFYDTTKGEVRIGGRNVRDIRYEDLLAHISIVFQKTFLTRDSVLENIRMGTQATLEQVPGGRPSGTDRRLHPVAAPGIRHQGWGYGLTLLRWGAPAHRHCPRYFEGRPHPHSGRGDLRRRPGESGGD